MKHILFPLVTLGLLLASVLCWGEEPSADQTRAIAAQANDAKKAAAQRLQTIATEYDSRCKHLGPFTKGEGKEAAGAYSEELEKLFADEVGRDSNKQKHMISDILLLDDNGFAHTALCELVKMLATQGRRGQLVFLLARRCPTNVRIHTGIEDQLIILSDESLKDGTLILCDAFDQSTDPSARKELSAALRRGFAAMGIKDSNDEKLVAAVRAWYRRNSNDWAPNFNYLVHFNTRFSYDKEGVLVKKTVKQQ